MAVSFTLNDKPIALDVDPNMPLLWAIREVARLTGTKSAAGWRNVARARYMSKDRRHAPA